ncbi:hypothetical protein SAMN05216342_3104 [Exiguobacterium indicum]|nr:hypothetical protein SAMN05216342_3104 [Exiguobacterium enclense]
MYSYSVSAYQSKFIFENELRRNGLTTKTAKIKLFSCLGCRTLILSKTDDLITHHCCGEKRKFL